MTTVDDIPVDHIIEKYDERQKLYQDFMNRQVTLLQEFIKENGPNVFSISGRVKERESLRNKLLTADKTYKKLEEITDIVGIRIVTYFEDEVEQIAEIIGREFKINESHILDKGETLDPDRFGYTSRHYIASLLDNRLELIEYKRFKGCKAEIQVRSLLQHAWAEIETQLGYKSREGFPRERRRNISRVAGLLELADQEFSEVKQFVRPLQEDMKPKKPDSSIDTINLADLIRDNAFIDEMDAKLADVADAKVIYNETFVDQLIENLAYLDVETINTLEEEIERRRKSAFALGKNHLLDRNTRYHSLWRGFSLHFICFALAEVSGRVDQIQEYLGKTKIGLQEKQSDMMPGFSDDDDGVVPPW
ncbi:MAG: hypothetical protein HQL53_00610 [Magnetococcales bacterium]|nr:hypothetical protein [Magnetococcales bacterium]